MGAFVVRFGVNFCFSQCFFFPQLNLSPPPLCSPPPRKPRRGLNPGHWLRGLFNLQRVVLVFNSSVVVWWSEACARLPTALPLTLLCLAPQPFPRPHMDRLQLLEIRHTAPQLPAMCPRLAILCCVLLVCSRVLCAGVCCDCLQTEILIVY